MKYQQLLYSRSENIDYRWLIYPSALTKNDLRTLEDLFWSDTFRSHIETEQLFTAPTYCFHLVKGSVLLEFRRTHYTDSTKKRAIDALQGIYVEREFVWYFRFALAWLLTEYRSLLDVWGSGTVDFDQADQVREKLSTEYLFDFGRLVSNSNPLPIDFSGDSRHQRQRILEFNEQGYLQLLAALYPSPNYTRLNLEQFAFGVLSSEKHKFETLDFVSYLGGSYGNIDKGNSSIILPNALKSEEGAKNTENEAPPTPNFENMVDSMRGSPRKTRSSKTKKQTEDNDPFSVILRKLNLRK
ncbi:MAG: hypothetical protein L6Q98_21520 [Anaerolineae bacterium]|nr:hypothetical protein [Anaerolineae bacterium]NUQ05518.1 hypothetical protein [Anaerolineae bacterium]